MAQGMFNRGAMIATLAAASLAMPAMAMSNSYALAEADAVAPVRRRQGSPWSGYLPKYRNRWKAERRAKRPNMNHVSKRTRRRHRRAKRAA